MMVEIALESSFHQAILLESFLESTRSGGHLLHYGFHSEADADAEVVVDADAEVVVSTTPQEWETLLENRAAGPGSLDPTASS